ncbi:hypothetical protein HPB47_003012 [Ixodes persulcatus]|uniref:Uncharacterized protein n=1 Tax=Ixodes persulcatus TaxID=34615 RepID=A0AC60PKL1_IXOPE|nr:hypothetical protein HPB47_003012 [Ixodes persulcatus]
MLPRFCMAENCGNDSDDSDMPINKFPNDEKLHALWIQLHVHRFRQSGGQEPAWNPFGQSFTQPSALSTTEPAADPVAESA